VGVANGATERIPPVANSSGSSVVYGEACGLSAASLKQYGITLKHVPTKTEFEHDNTKERR